MELEIHLLTRKIFIGCDKDAAACYDRQTAFFANITGRKYGQHRKVCIIQGRTLEEAKYRLRTKLRISDQVMQHTILLPWFGTGQGAGGSSTIWLCESSEIIDIFESQASGATYTSPDGSVSLTIFILSFVDDVKTRTNDFTAHPQPSIQEIATQASADSQLWHNLLNAINQSLQVTKCKYHLLHFDFLPSGEPQIVEDKQPPVELQVYDKQDQPIKLTHVPSSKAITYLGCQKAIGNQSDQYNATKKRCDDYARVINCSQLQRHETHRFYEGIYKLSVGYPLPLCYFTYDQLNKIQTKAHMAMVSHCGYNRYTAKEILFGPKFMGGAAFFHLFDIQGVGQVNLFLKFWRSSPHCQSGKILRVALSWTQFCAGTSAPILLDTTTPLPHLESTWITSLRQYLFECQATIEVDTPFVPAIQRTNDAYLMEIAHSHNFTKGQTKRVNYCRMYLNVVTVSDIANAAGTHIDPGMYSGNLNSMSSSSKWHPVNQARPDDKSWKQWRRLLHLLCQRRHTKTLREPLGAWLVEPNALRRHWPFWHQPITDTLYHWTPDGTSSHQRLIHDFDKDVLLAMVDIPAGSIPVDITEHSHTWSLRQQFSSWQLTPQTPAPNTLLQHILTLPTWEKALLSGLELLVDADVFLAQLSSSPILACSDGSSQTTRGSFAWYLSTQTGERLARCSGPVFGHKISSYRAEGYGILSLCRFLFQLRGFCKINVNIHPICDNKAMVGKANLQPKLNLIYPN